MGALKRVVEVYIGVGSDSGTWHTEYVEIPRETSDDMIEEVALNEAKRIVNNYMFVGIYAIPSLDESDEIMEYGLEESE